MKKEYRLQFFLFTAALILIAFISSKLYFRIDTTEQKVYTLSPYTEKLLADLKSTVQVTWFKTKNIYSFFPQLRYLNDILFEYQAASDGKFIVTEKNTENLSQEAIRSLGLIPRQIETQNSSSSSLFTMYSGLMIEYRGETRLIPFIDDIDIVEYDIGRFISDIEASIKSRFYDKTIAVLAPPNSLDGEYSYVKAWLEYAGFDIAVLSLPFENLSSEIPLLVLGSGYIDFSSAAAIDAFLQKEGRAIFFVSGNNVDVRGKWTASPKINDHLLEVLAKQGFYIQADLVLDIINFRLTLSAADNSEAKVVNYPFWLQVQGSNVESSNPIFSAYKPLQTFWPSSILIDTDKNKNLMELAHTSSNAITMVDSYNTDPFGNQLKLFGGTNQAAQTIIAGRERPSRVIVISDEYMVSNAVDYAGSSYNLDFLVSCAEYITGKDGLIFLKNKRHAAPPFKQFSTNDEFNFIVFRSRLVSFVILPLFILGLGIYMLILQRKHQ